MGTLRIWNGTAWEEVTSAGTEGSDSFLLTVNAAPTAGQYIVADVTGTDATAPVITLDGGA